MNSFEKRTLRIDVAMKRKDADLVLKMLLILMYLQRNS
jgi:hypothetical protein